MNAGVTTLKAAHIAPSSICIGRMFKNEREIAYRKKTREKIANERMIMGFRPTLSDIRPKSGEQTLPESDPAV